MQDPKPLFVIGMPRSGTKLLRTILHNHSRVGIAKNETEFLPVWIREWTSYGNLTDKETFHRFYKRCLGFPYFQNQLRKGTVISEDDWFLRSGDKSIASVFGALIDYDIGFKQNLLWRGDKSPGYTTRLLELASEFPAASFVHICRDPRDYAISVKKAWGKDMIRAVQDWKEGLAYVRSVASRENIRLKTIHYEALIANPESALREVCDFLNVCFEPAMLEFERAVESVGDAAGAKRIVSDNLNKYKRALPDSVVRKMESIVGLSMKDWGYKAQFVEGDQNRSASSRRLRHMRDSFNVVLNTIKRRGLWYGLKYSILFRLMKNASNSSVKQS
jgi:hypothetical protein